jgi:hypothetical protein
MRHGYIGPFIVGLLDGTQYRLYTALYKTTVVATQSPADVLNSYAKNTPLKR